MKLWTIVILMTGCAMGHREVKYNEMSSEPRLIWNGRDMIIETRNSKENSALSIYEIKSTIDKINHLIFIRGRQAAGEEYRTEFKIDLKDINSDELDNYKFYWVDPDEKQTELKVEKNSDHLAPNTSIR